MHLGIEFLVLVSMVTVLHGETIYMSSEPACGKVYTVDEPVTVKLHDPTAKIVTEPRTCSISFDCSTPGPDAQCLLEFTRDNLDCDYYNTFILYDGMDNSSRILYMSCTSKSTRLYTSGPSVTIQYTETRESSFYKNFSIGVSTFWNNPNANRVYMDSTYCGKTFNVTDVPTLVRPTDVTSLVQNNVTRCNLTFVIGYSDAQDYGFAIDVVNDDIFSCGLKVELDSRSTLVGQPKELLNCFTNSGGKRHFPHGSAIFLVMSRDQRPYFHNTDFSLLVQVVNVNLTLTTARTTSTTREGNSNSGPASTASFSLALLTLLVLMLHPGMKACDF